MPSPWPRQIRPAGRRCNFQHLFDVSFQLRWRQLIRRIYILLFSAAFPAVMPAWFFSWAIAAVWETKIKAAATANHFLFRLPNMSVLSPQKEIENQFGAPVHYRPCRQHVSIKAYHIRAASRSANISSSPITSCPRTCGLDNRQWLSSLPVVRWGRHADRQFPRPAQSAA